MKHLKVAMTLFQMVLLFGMMPLLSCKAQAQPAPSVEKTDSKPQLVFLNYTITKDANGNLETRFVNKIIADGRLKDNSHKKELNKVGDIECIQYDKNHLVIERSYISNPLKPIVEYVNDDGDLEKRQLDLGSAQFSIKLQLDERTQGIRLMLMDASGNPKTELITTLISK